MNEIDLLIERLKRVVDAHPDLRLTIAQGEVKPALQARLRQSGRVSSYGQELRLDPDDGPSWSLPPAYVYFLDRYGSLEVKELNAHVLCVQGVNAAAWQTEEFIGALSDHRHGQWASEDAEAYGIDRCVMFSSTAYMTGFAFDTRMPDAAGEFAIRRVVDCGIDEGAELSTYWPAEPSTKTMSFETWLSREVDELAKRVPPAVSAISFSIPGEPSTCRFAIAGVLSSFDTEDVKHMILDVGGEMARSLRSAGCVILGEENVEGDRRFAVLSRAGSDVLFLSEDTFRQWHQRWAAGT